MTKRSGGFGLQTARVVKYALGEVELNLANSPKERQKQFNLDVFLQVPRRTGVSTYVVNMLSGHSVSILLHFCRACMYLYEACFVKCSKFGRRGS
jgi:hypothetical protein